MTLQDIENQALQLSERDRWQLVHSILESLRQNATPDSRAHSILETLNAIYSQEVVHFSKGQRKRQVLLVPTASP